MKLQKNLTESYRFTRIVFGIIMIAAFFFELGKYVVAVLGVLFLISAATGFCITCRIYDKIWGCKTCKLNK